MNEPLGLTALQLENIERIFSKIFTHKSSWQIEVFGSRARGDHKRYSDLDLWIDCNPATTSQELNQLREAFEDSDLPIKIDLVTPDSVLKEFSPQIMTEKKTWLLSSERTSGAIKPSTSDK